MKTDEAIKLLQLTDYGAPDLGVENGNERVELALLFNTLKMVSVPLLFSGGGKCERLRRPGTQDHCLEISQE